LWMIGRIRQLLMDKLRKATSVTEIALAPRSSTPVIQVSRI